LLAAIGFFVSIRFISGIFYADNRISCPDVNKSTTDLTSILGFRAKKYGRNSKHAVLKSAFISDPKHLVLLAGMSRI